jgi:hypothetical protein
VHDRHKSSPGHRVYLASVAHFARWLGEQRLGLSSLSAALQDRFLNDHLPIEARRATTQFKFSGKIDKLTFKLEQ